MSAYIVNRETIDAIVDSIMDPPQSGCFGGFDPYLFDPIVKAGPTGFKENIPCGLRQHHRSRGTTGLGHVARSSSLVAEP